MSLVIPENRIEYIQVLIWVFYQNLVTWIHECDSIDVENPIVGKELGKLFLYFNYGRYFRKHNAFDLYHKENKNVSGFNTNETCFSLTYKSSLAV